MRRAIKTQDLAVVLEELGSILSLRLQIRLPHNHRIKVLELLVSNKLLLNLMLLELDLELTHKALVAHLLEAILCLDSQLRLSTTSLNLKLKLKLGMASMLLLLSNKFTLTVSSLISN